MPRTTLILPDQLEHWFVDLSARFDPHSDGPEGLMTTPEDRTEIWRKFEQNWAPIIRYFSAGNVGVAYSDEALDHARFAKAVAQWQRVDTRFIEVTHLPDVWISVKSGARLIPTLSAHRDTAYRGIIGGAEVAICDQAALDAAPRGTHPPTPNRDLLEEDLRNEDIRVVRVSGAEFNPRYRGKIEKSATVVTRLLASCAAGLVRSKPIEEPVQDGES